MTSMKALRNDYFKTALVSHLVGSWNDDALANVVESKIIFVTCEEKCYSFTNENDRVVRREEANMVNLSEEADKRMLYQITSVSSPGNVVLRTYDTDVLCIALGIRNQLSRDHHIWLEVGHYTNNTLRYIDVDKIHGYLGDRLCNSLLALYIFT